MNALPLVHFFCPCMPGSPARREVHAMSPYPDESHLLKCTIPSCRACCSDNFNLPHPGPDPPVCAARPKPAEPAPIEACRCGRTRAGVPYCYICRPNTWKPTEKQRFALQAWYEALPLAPPPAPEAKAAAVPHESTAEEKNVAALLGLAWDAFIKLPGMGPQDREDFRRSLNHCQMLVSHRLAVRVEPEFWVP